MRDRKTHSNVWRTREVGTQWGEGERTGERGQDEQHSGAAVWQGPPPTVCGLHSLE